MSLSDKLARLAELHASGALTDAEYSAAKSATLREGEERGSRMAEQSPVASTTPRLSTDASETASTASGEEPAQAGLTDQRHGRPRFGTFAAVLGSVAILALAFLGYQLANGKQGPAFGDADGERVMAALTDQNVERCGEGETAPGPADSTATIFVVGPPCTGEFTSNYLLLYEFSESSGLEQQVEEMQDGSTNAWQYGQFIVVGNPNVDSSTLAGVERAMESLGASKVAAANDRAGEVSPTSDPTPGVVADEERPAPEETGDVVITNDGLEEATLGSDMDQAVDWVSGRIGAPDADEPDGCGGYRMATWDDAVVLGGDEGTVAYVAVVGRTDRAEVRTANGTAVGDRFADETSRLGVTFFSFTEPHNAFNHLWFDNDIDVGGLLTKKNGEVATIEVGVDCRGFSRVPQGD